LLELALQITQERDKRVPTATINAAMQEAFAGHPPPSARASD